MVNENRARIRSLFIVHTAMLILTLGSSIIYTGLYPYLELVREVENYLGSKVHTKLVTMYVNIISTTKDNHDHINFLELVAFISSCHSQQKYLTFKFVVGSKRETGRIWVCGGCRRIRSDDFLTSVWDYGRQDGSNPGSGHHLRSHFLWRKCVFLSGAPDSQRNGRPAQAQSLGSFGGQIYRGYWHRWGTRIMPLTYA